MFVHGQLILPQELYCRGKITIAKTADTYWNAMTDVVAALNKTDHATKEKIKRDVHQAVNQKYTYGNVLIDSSALVIYGEK